MSIRKYTLADSTPLSEQVSINGYTGAALERIVAMTTFTGAVSPSVYQSHARSVADRVGRSRRFATKSKALAAIRAVVRQEMAQLTAAKIPVGESAMDTLFATRLQTACSNAGVDVPDWDINWTQAAATLGVPAEFAADANDPADVALSKSVGRQLMNELTSYVRSFAA